MMYRVGDVLDEIRSMNYVIENLILDDSGYYKISQNHVNNLKSIFRHYEDMLRRIKVDKNETDN